MHSEYQNTYTNIEDTGIIPGSFNSLSDPFLFYAPIDLTKERSMDSVEFSHKDIDSLQDISRFEPKIERAAQCRVGKPLLELESPTRDNSNCFSRSSRSFNDTQAFQGVLTSKSSESTVLNVSTTEEFPESQTHSEISQNSESAKKVKRKKLIPLKKKSYIKKAKKNPFWKTLSLNSGSTKEETDFRPISEFLTLPSEFKPKSKEEMDDPQKVYFTKRKGHFSTFPLTYISICERQEKLRLKKEKINSKGIKKTKKRRKRKFNPFEGPKGVKLPSLTINWASETPSKNFHLMTKYLLKSKSLNFNGSQAFMRIYIMHKHFKKIQKML